MRFVQVSTLRAGGGKRQTEKEDFVRKFSICFCLASLLIALSTPALAQSHVFFSGDVFGDVKRFSGDSTESTPDAVRIGGGGSVGLLVADRWDVRGEVEAGGTTTVMRPLLPPLTAFQSRTRDRVTAFSALVGFHPVLGQRVGFTVIGGVSFLHVTTQFDSVPSGLVVSPHTDENYVAAPTVGAEVPIVLSRHLSVVPELRIHAFTLGKDQRGGFAIRPGVAIRWSF